MIERDGEGSCRGLMRWLNSRGVRTREGYEWSTRTVIQKLRNPLYMGKPVLNHSQVTYVRKTDEDTGETNLARVIIPRAETFSVAPGMLPTIVDPAVFARVQAMLDAPNSSAGRLGRANSPHPADATLLHSGYVRCAHCKRAMMRMWRPANLTHPNGVPQYRCTAGSGTMATCKHSMPAADTDEFALRGLARAMSDPERIIALADAAEQRIAEADYRVVKTTNNIEAMNALIAETEKRAADTQAAIAALGKLPGQEDTVTKLRGDLLNLSVTFDRATAERARLSPQRERASVRADFLRAMFTTSQRYFPFSGKPIPDSAGQARIGIPGTRLRDDGTIEDYHTLTLEQASGMIGQPIEGTDIPIHREPAHTEPTRELDDEADALYRTMDASAFDEWLAQHLGHERTVNVTYPASASVERADVIYRILRHMSHATLRKLLRELGVTVWITRPRTAEERAAHGNTPAAHRVTVQIGNLAIAGRALTGSASVTNATPYIHSTAR
jgi:uncharacterized coiled-coil protein SlyX